MQRRLAQIATPGLLLIALLCAACGASARTLALRTSLVTLNVARDTLRTTSKDREDQIIAKATSKEEGKAKLATWRSGVDKIAATIDDAYHLIYGAALLDDAKSAQDAATAVTKVLELIKDLQALKDPLVPPATPVPTPAAKEKS